MNKYKWLLGLIFANFFGVAIHSEIQFGIQYNKRLYNFSIDDISSLTYDKFLTSIANAVQKELSHINFPVLKRGLRVMFDGRHLAHPHNFKKWKEYPLIADLVLLLQPESQSGRQVWFFDKIYHRASWAHNVLTLNLPANPSVEDVKMKLHDKLSSKYPRISWEQIKLFSSDDSDVELTDADLGNESTLDQGISFSFTSIEKEIHLNLKNAPAGIQGFYPEGIPFKIKQYYTTTDDVLFHLAEVLDFLPKSDFFEQFDINLKNDDNDFFNAVVSFKKNYFFGHKTIKTNIRVLEVINNKKFESSSYNDIKLLNPSYDLTVHQFVENFLAPKGKDLSGSVAIRYHNNGKTILDADNKLKDCPEAVLTLQILVVPEDWQEVPTTLIRFEENKTPKRNEQKEQFWLPVAKPNLWRFALAYQIGFPDPEKLKDTNSAVYVSDANEDMDFSGQKIFQAFPSEFPKSTPIQSLKIHLNQEKEKEYNLELDRLNEQLESIFKGDDVVQVAVAIIAALATIDKNIFSNIHQTAEYKLVMKLQGLGEKFKEITLNKNISDNMMNELLKINGSYSALLDLLLPICRDRPMKKFKDVKRKQITDIQNIYAQRDREAQSRDY